MRFKDMELEPSMSSLGLLPSAPGLRKPEFDEKFYIFHKERGAFEQNLNPGPPGGAAERPIVPADLNPCF